MEWWYSRGIRIGLFIVVAVAFAVTAAIMIIAILTETSGTSSHQDGGMDSMAAVTEMELTKGSDLDGSAPEVALTPSLSGPLQLQEASSNLEAVATPTMADPTPVPTPTPVPPQVIFVEYAVKPGDSLYSISAVLNSSIELMAINGIDAGNVVAGGMIRVPVANPAFCPGSRAYVVRERDTLFGIALTMNSTAEAIMAANNFPAGYFIKATEVICVPEG